MVQWLKKKNLRFVALKLFKYPLSIHLPPTTSSWGCLCNRLVFWNNNRSEQDSWIQGIQVHSSQFESPQFFSSSSRESRSSLTTLLARKVCAISKRPPFWRGAGEMHETRNFNNCMLPCSYYLLRLTSPSGLWPSSESSHVLMWLLKEG